MLRDENGKQQNTAGRDRTCHPFILACDDREHTQVGACPLLYYSDLSVIATRNLLPRYYLSRQLRPA